MSIQEKISDEQRIEQMILSGRNIMAEAMAGRRIVGIVAAYSSGDDSIVSTHFGMSQYQDCTVFNADTLFGLAPSREHLLRVCESMKWELHVEQATAEGPPKTTLVRGSDGKKHHEPFDPAVLPAGKWADAGCAYEEFVCNFGFPGRGKPQHVGSAAFGQMIPCLLTTTPPVPG